MFDKTEKQHIIDAITSAIKSNERQTKQKPQYSIITHQIDTELNNLLLKIKNIKELPAK